MRGKKLETKIIEEHLIDEIVQLIQQGEVVAFPTETVYGLGANALDSKAVKKIFSAKGRPSDNPLNVLVSTKEAMYHLAKDVPKYVDELIASFSPGPITYVLKSAAKVANEVTANLSTIGLRIPNHPITLEILEKTQLPIAAPSANVSGRPSPTSAEHVIHDLKGKIAAIVDGGTTNVGLESTVVDCTGEVPVILRSGFITSDDIKQVTGACEVAPALQMTSNKYKHYVPEVPLIVVRTEEQFNEAVLEEKAAGHRVGIITADGCHNINVEKVYQLGKSEEETAQNLYHVLRSIKKSEVDIVISAFFPSKIVMDRLTLAATKII